MRKPLTLKQIASAAGVSEMTASRALRNAHDVSASTRERVIAMAKEMGYVPNKIAGSLASNKVDLVGVVIPSVKSYVFSEVLDGISSVLSGTALRPVFGLTDYDLEVEEATIRQMLSWRPSGLIVAGLEHSENARAMLGNCAIPVVEIMDTDGEPIDLCVGFSHRKAGAAMAQAIYDRGYRKIGFIGTKMEQDFRAQKRRDGFLRRLSELGIDDVNSENYTEGSTIAKGREVTARLLSRAPDTQCIYYSTDVSAIGGLMHCYANGISVPKELALAGFNKLSMRDGMPIALATIDSNRFEIGKMAADLILRRLAEKGPEGPFVKVLASDVILGQSL